MAMLLGIDTGGTFTDAVLFDEDAGGTGVVTKAKALTTKQDLSIGIGNAVDATLAQIDGVAGIALVSISTTLATNALVEGQGGRIALILIGFDDGALGRAGLGDALAGDPAIFVAGGHSATGDRQAPLDQGAIRAGALAHAGNVDAFAIVAHFGVRNPEDERIAREIVREATGLPITCGHDLSANLNGPKRAVTSVLNARLVGMITALIAATEAILTARGIAAPLMLVRGDGSLVSADFAKARPIETILSGPAASLVGAAHLTGIEDAVISDIGGTTTDIAVLRGGRPAIRADGAAVGGHQTMVEAVDMVTHGLGGDSLVTVDDSRLQARLVLGPRRAIPISLLAHDHPDLVHRALDLQLQQARPDEHDARFLVANPAARQMAGLREADAALLEAIGAMPKPAHDVLKARAQSASLARLVAQGLVRIAAFTPSDAAHVLGHHAAWDGEAARKAATLMARKRDGQARAIAPGPEAFSDMTYRAVIRGSAAYLLDAALAHDGVAPDMAAPFSDSALARRALDGHSGAARLSIGLDLPLVGLGASAPLYYPPIAARLGTGAIVPEDADVANAVGAVVGRVRISREAVITQPSEGCFRVHLPGAGGDFPTLEAATAHLWNALRAAAVQDAQAAGASSVETRQEWSEKTATTEGKRVFIEGHGRVVASGRPRLAS